MTNAEPQLITHPGTRRNPALLGYSLASSHHNPEENRVVDANETFNGTWPFKPHFTDAPGFRMHYVDEGQGEPILCIHGEPMWGYLYRKFIGPLSRTNRVVVPDHMGFGKSQTPQDRTYTLKTHVENLTAQLAEEANASEEVIAAALLHDIGHFTHDFPVDAADQGIDSRHEEAGARVLKNWFPQVVLDCVREHVAAKRYLCATDPDYFAKLSPASVHSLNLQGGPMAADEVATFEQNPNYRDIVQVRIWDDEGKVPGHKTPGFEYYMPLLKRVVDRHKEAT